MPLIRSSSPKAFKKNAGEMVKSGHPQRQALAAAYQMQRSAAGKAKHEPSRGSAMLKRAKGARKEKYCG